MNAPLRKRTLTQMSSEERQQYIYERLLDRKTHLMGGASWLAMGGAEFVAPGSTIGIGIVMSLYYLGRAFGQQHGLLKTQPDKTINAWLAKLVRVPNDNTVEKDRFSQATFNRAAKQTPVTHSLKAIKWIVAGWTSGRMAKDSANYPGLSIITTALYTGFAVTAFARAAKAQWDISKARRIEANSQMRNHNRPKFA